MACRRPWGAISIVTASFGIIHAVDHLLRGTDELLRSSKPIVSVQQARCSDCDKVYCCMELLYIRLHKRNQALRRSDQ
ncbi:hypothetical protein PUN28_015884 [Cardiocondyla obscurior]|uniref:Secreted protein n=1 Tax=Cardiocondyla obscurior TaxID=286306 RepID=A0AAW2ESD2_9HYME